VKTLNIFRLLLGLSISIHFWVTPVAAQEVIVLGGPEEGMQWLTAERWWGEEERGEQLSVPRAIITGINPSWRQTAQELTVAEKKEVFYRFMLPLVVHANGMVLDRRGNDVITAVPVLKCYTFYREIVALGSSAGEHDFVARTAQEVRHLAPSGLDGFLRWRAGPVKTGWVPIVVGQIRPHGLGHFPPGVRHWLGHGSQRLQKLAHPLRDVLPEFSPRDIHRV